MYIYILKQKRFNRVKVGFSRRIENRILKLERVWGKFDSDSVVCQINANTMRKLNITLTNIETYFHVELKLMGLFIEDLDKADGYKEFFVYDNRIEEIIDIKGNQLIDKKQYITELTLKTKKQLISNENLFTLPENFRPIKDLTMNEMKFRDYILKLYVETLNNGEYNTSYHEETKQEIVNIEFIYKNFNEFNKFIERKTVRKLLKLNNSLKDLIVGYKEIKQGHDISIHILIKENILKELYEDNNKHIIYKRKTLNCITSKYSYLFMKKIMSLGLKGKKIWNIEEFRNILFIPKKLKNNDIKTRIVEKIYEDLKDSDIVLKRPIYTYSTTGQKTITHIEFTYSR